MKKLLTIFIIFLSLINYSQTNDINKYKMKLDSISRATSDCIEKIVSYRLEIKNLENQKDSLEKTIDKQSITLSEAKTKQQIAEKQLNSETRKKQKLFKLVLGEGILITGGVIAFITGAWVPVCITVGLVELYLLVENKVHIEIKQTKI